MTADQNRRSLLLLLVASGMMISLCMGLRQSLGLFMRPMTLELAGVTASAFGFAIALQNIVWGVSQPVVGAIADRYGPKPVLLITGALFAIGLLVMSGAQGPAGLDFSGLLIGLGIAGTGFGVVIGAVTRATPPEKRSQTVGAVAAAGSLGTLLIAPLGQTWIDSYGWRGALIGFACVAALMTLLSFGVREQAPPPGTATNLPRQSAGDALRIAIKHRGFLAMTAAYFACGFQLVFIVTHLPQYLELCGVSPSLGATALGLIGLFNTIGTFAFGMLGARYSQKRLLALIYLLRTLSIVAFISLPVTPVTTLAFATAMGLLWLGVAPLVTGIVGRIFGVTHFNMLFGVSFLSHQLGSFCGAWMGGLVFDFTGSYTFAWMGLVAIGAFAFTLQWTMDDKPAPHARTVPSPAAA